MAVDQVSTRPVLAPAPIGAQDSASMREGTVIDGRVVAVNSDDSLRLATRYGLLDVDPSQVSLHGGARGRLPPASDLLGTTVKLEVMGQSSTNGRLSVRLLAPGDPASTSQEADTTSADAELATRLSAEISQAAARQDGLAPVFAGARQLASLGATVPDELAQAIADLAGHALDGAAPISGDAIRSAVAGSGLFFEARLQRLAAGMAAAGFRLDPASPLASQDLKAALYGLKSALDDWIAAAAAEVPDPASTAPGTAAGAAPPTAGSASARADSANQPQTASFDAEALFAVIRPPPVVSGASGQATSGTTNIVGGLVAQMATSSFGGPGGRPDLASMAALGAWLQSSGQLPAGGRRDGYGGRTLRGEPGPYSAHASDGAPSGRPPPPHRGSLPQGQAAADPSNVTAKHPVEMARELAVKTGDALARVALGQFASLPEDVNAAASGPHHPAPATTAAQASFLFEIPIRIGERTSVAQFEIDQVGTGGSTGEHATPAWRVQFSLDVAPLGPVHVRLTLADRRLSVGLWAEDRLGATALQRGILSLRQSLEASRFTVDEIHFAAGRPPSGPPVQAGGFVDRNA